MLLASNKNKQRHETKRVKEEEPQASTSSSSLDPRIESMVETMKAMGKLMEKLSLDNKTLMINQNEPQIKNQNFRRQQGPPIPQVMPRVPRNPNDQQIRPPF